MLSRARPRPCWPPQAASLASPLPPTAAAAPGACLAPCPPASRSRRGAAQPHCLQAGAGRGLEGDFPTGGGLQHHHVCAGGWVEGRAGRGGQGWGRCSAQEKQGGVVRAPWDTETLRATCGLHQESNLAVEAHTACCHLPVRSAPRRCAAAAARGAHCRRVCCGHQRRSACGHSCARRLCCRRAAGAVAATAYSSPASCSAGSRALR